jgi:hypothetical protein
MAGGHRCRDRRLTGFGTVTIGVAAGAGIGRRRAATAWVNAEVIAWALAARADRVIGQGGPEAEAEGG